MAWSRWSARARSRLLEAATRELQSSLRDGAERAAGRAQRTLVSATVPVEGIDPCAAAFEELVRPFGLIEMVRTGEIAVSRGRGTT